MQYYSKSDLARRWKVHHVTIWRRVKAGELPPPVEILPNVYRWSDDVIAAYEADRRVPEEYAHLTTAQAS
jgi:predicted DNA-binding transcriptional regulator AlpA